MITNVNNQKIEIAFELDPVHDLLDITLLNCYNGEYSVFSVDKDLSLLEFIELIDTELRKEE